MFITARPSRAGVVNDAVADYLAGWESKSNPNGVWSYGWSTNPGVSLNLYDSTTLSPNSNWDAWTSTINDLGYVPGIFFNTGGAYNDGNVDVAAGALWLHGGGLAADCGETGGCFSEIVWTAPQSGVFNLSASLTGGQFNENLTGQHGFVEIIDATGGGTTTLLSGLIQNQTSQSFDGEIMVQAGDTVTFAARDQSAMQVGDASQLEATFTLIPEPPSAWLLLLGISAVTRLRKSSLNLRRLYRRMPG